MRYVFLAPPNQNMVMNRSFIARILTSLVSLESWQSQRFNDANFIKIRAIYGRFLAKLKFWDIFDNFQICEKITKIRLKMRPYIARILTKLASLKR